MVLPAVTAGIPYVQFRCFSIVTCINAFLQDYNIRTGVEFFANTLKSNDNNVVLTLGMYNGWSKGLTVVSLN